MSDKEQEKKVLDSTADLISSLTKKIDQIDLNEIKKMGDSGSGAAMGLIVCCTSMSSKDIKNKNKKKK